MKYDFRLNLKLIEKDWKNNVLKVFCLALGIVMGSLFLYQFNAAVQDYYKNKGHLNFDNIVVLSPDWQDIWQDDLPHERFLQPEEMEQIWQENDEILSVHFENLVARTSIIANKRFALASISIINQDFNQTSQFIPPPNPSTGFEVGDFLRRLVKTFLAFGFGTLIRINVDLKAFFVLFLIVQLIYGTYAYFSYKKILRQSTIEMIQC